MVFVEVKPVCVPGGVKKVAIATGETAVAVVELSIGALQTLLETLLLSMLLLGPPSEFQEESQRTILHLRQKRGHCFSHC